MQTAGNNHQDKRLVQVARLFYEEQLSKSEIANQQRISITHVNRLLREAQKKGVVEVVIKAPRFERLETELMRRFSLREVRVVQAAPDSEYVRKELAGAAAEYLEPLLANGAKVGVASGRTIFETVSRLKETPREIEIYPLNVPVNSETRIKSLSANTIATVLWFKSRPLSRAYLLELFFPNESISEVRRSAQSLLGGSEAKHLESALDTLDIYLLGASDLRSDSQLVELSERSGTDYSKLRRNGVVGDIAFNTLGASGEDLPIDLEDLTFHIHADDLKSASKKREGSVILIAGGSEKLPVIRAALRVGMLNCLITDSDSAEALLSTQQQKSSGAQIIGR